MPSSPNYKRNYEQESKTAKERGEDKDNAARHRARYAMEKAGKVSRNDGKDVAHVKALSKGGKPTDLDNLKAESPSSNRSFARNKDGSMKSEHSKKEKK